MKWVMLIPIRMVLEKDGQEIILNYYESADHGSADANIIAQSMQSEAKNRY